MKSILLKIVCILVAAIVIQYVIEYTWPNELPALAKIRRIDTDDILYLGDSTIAWTSRSDADRRSIADYLEELLHRKIVRHDTPGYNLSAFLNHVVYLVRSGSKPDLIIMTINIHSFSPEWDLNPMFQFKKEAFIANAGLLRPFYRAICAYTECFRNDPPKRWLNTPVYDGTRWVGRVRDFEGDSFTDASPENMRKKIVYRFRGGVSADHHKISELGRICSLAKANGQQLLVYFTPLDMEALDACCEGTSDQVRQNIATVKRELDAWSVPYLDMSASLPAKSFTWRANLYPNAHLAEEGRRYVAATLAAAIGRK